MPLAALACGQEFSAGAGDGGEETGIIFGDGGGSHDATSLAGDGATDARQDGPHDGGIDHDAGVERDGNTTMDGMAETGPICPSGWLTCSDGGCAQEGPTNCGTCGNDCTMLPNVMGAQCSAGQCTFTCAPGWQNCTSNQGAGCATNVTQQGNCGACNVTCSGNTPVCNGAGCVSGCDAGTTLCNGTCANTSSDPQNCMTCGNVCPAGPANSQPTCSSGVCGFQCDNGYSNCSGACVNESNDPNHCNGCSTVCAGTAHGQPVCNSGACGIVCDADYQACTGSNPASCILISPLNGVTVAPDGDSTTSCGSAGLPCANITLAINKANMLGLTDIFVAEGTYQDQVTLGPGLSIHGGWVYSGAGQWAHPCALDASKTIIQALPGASSVFIANYTGGPAAQLDTLTIQNQPSAPSPSQSIYGLLANGNGTLVQLDNVDIEMGTAGSGTTGMAGSPGSGATCGSSSNGETGQFGAAGPPGGYTSGGYQSGAAGGNGDAGELGTPPGFGYPGGTCTVTTCKITCANPPSCTTDDCTDTTGATLTGGNGSAGCSGNPGQGGTGGTGGGASIGVYAWGSGTQVAVGTDGAKVYAGTGGAGGDGGAGGAGAMGIPGTTGSPATCTQAYCAGAHSTSCTPNGNTTAAGGDGGILGGPGGYGGQGGGGHGGDSFCYYAGGGAVVTGSVTCTVGAAGQGGSPNGSGGTVKPSGP